MKTTNTTKTLMALATLIPCLGLAQANNQELSQEVLQTLRAQSTQQDTAQIRFAPEQTVKDAIKKLNGKATLDFGNKQIKIDQQMKSGGVVIGSGADGLAATNNSNPNGPIVVNPPVTPQTSITVVGRAGAGQEVEFCTEEILDETQAREIKNDKKCTDLNKPLRLSEGKFILNFMEMRIFVSLQKGERKIIPLREIHTPKQDMGFSANLEYDFADTKTQVDHLNYSITNARYELCHSVTETYELCMKMGDALRAEHIQPFFKYYARNTKIYSECKKAEGYACQFGTIKVRQNINWLYPKFHYPIFSLGKGYDGSFFSVLPGVYQIVWTIDGQEEVTQGIHVQ